MIFFINNVNIKVIDNSFFDNFSNISSCKLVFCYYLIKLNKNSKTIFYYILTNFFSKYYTFKINLL